MGAAVRSWRELRDVADEMFAPERVEDCNDPAELGYVFVAGHQFTPDEADELGDHLHVLAETARRAVR